MARWLLLSKSSHGVPGRQHDRLLLERLQHLEMVSSKGMSHLLDFCKPHSYEYIDVVHVNVRSLDTCQTFPRNYIHPCFARWFSYLFWGILFVDDNLEDKLLEPVCGHEEVALLPAVLAPRVLNPPSTMFNYSLFVLKYLFLRVTFPFAQTYALLSKWNCRC